MSLLPSATFAGPSPAEALWAVAGSSGSGGVTQLVAGTNITLDPPTGEGVVTVNATGGGGGVASVTGVGDGIIVNTVSNAVTVQNSGVTMLTAGAGITLDGTTGNLNISTSGTLPAGDITVSGNLHVTGTSLLDAMLSGAGVGLVTSVQPATTSIPSGTASTTIYSSINLNGNYYVIGRVNIIAGGQSAVRFNLTSFPVVPAGWNGRGNFAWSMIQDTSSTYGAVPKPGILQTWATGTSAQISVEPGTSTFPTGTQLLFIIMLPWGQTYLGP